MAQRPVTLADIAAGHVSLEIAGFDRVYLNGWVPALQTSGQVAGWLGWLGFPIASPRGWAGSRRGSGPRCARTRRTTTSRGCLPEGGPEAGGDPSVRHHPRTRRDRRHQPAARQPAEPGRPCLQDSHRRPCPPGLTRHPNTLRNQQPVTSGTTSNTQPNLTRPSKSLRGK
jgi:hypothetical protein